MTKLWLIQNSPALLEKEANLKKLLIQAEQAAQQGAELIAFPECALNGFMVAVGELAEQAEPVPGAATGRVAELCDRYGVYIAFGLLEKRGGQYFNSAVLLGPQQYLFCYAKIHVSSAGVDTIVSGGDAIRVADTPLGKIGIVICYDIRFPELCRVLALQGAQLILNLSNWPRGAEVNPGLFIPARAAENNVFVAGVNRVGSERGITYFGGSTVVSPDGVCLACAGPGETIVTCDIPIAAQQPGIKYMAPSNIWLDLFADRRPELYDALVQPKTKHHGKGTGNG